jgi:hypothetical protein
MNHSVQNAEKTRKNAEKTRKDATRRLRKGTVRDIANPGSNLQGPDIRKSRFLLIEKEGIPMYQDEKHPMMTI